MAASPESLFESELEHFRNEVVDSTCSYYVPRTVSFLAAGNRAIHRALNRTPLIWNASATAFQNSLFVVLGRIFDQQSGHGIDALMGLAQDNPNIFEKPALEARKRRADPNADHWLPEYMEQVYVPTPDDFRGLRRSIAEQRRVYEQQFREIRRKYVAHREIADPDAVAELFGRAQFAPLEQLLGYLESFHLSLQDMLLNGNRPELRPRTINLQALVEAPIDQIHRQYAPEMAVYDVRRCLELLLAGSAQWVRDARR